MENKIKIIKNDGIFDIKMSTGFYKRLEAAAYFIVQGKTEEEIAEAYKQIQAKEIKDEWVFHYETILVVCKEFQKAASEQDGIEEITQEEHDAKIKEFEESNQ